MLAYLRGWPCASFVLPLNPSDPFAAFGALLHDRRLACGLSRVALAEQAGLSAATIKFIETRRHRPSRATLHRLIAVSVLKLSWSDVPELPAKAPAPDVPCHSTITLLATHDQVGGSALLDHFFSGVGGYLPQSLGFRDTHAAADYLRAIKGVVWSQHSELAAVLGSSSFSSVQVVALGVRDASFIGALCESVAGAGKRLLDVCLVEQSMPVLCAAISQIGGSACLVDSLESTLVAGAIPRISGCGRVFVMAGSLSDLDGREQPLFCYGFTSLAAAGDLLILAVATTDRIPAVADPVPARVQSWLLGLITRHYKGAGPNVITVDWRRFVGLEPLGAVLHCVGTVRPSSGPQKEYSLTRFRFYSVAALVALICQEAWSHVATWNHSPSDGCPVLVFVRTPKR